MILGEILFFLLWTPTDILLRVQYCSRYKKALGVNISPVKESDLVLPRWEGKGIPTPDVKYSCNNIWRSCRSRGIGRIAVILVMFCLSHQRSISRTSETGSNDPSQGDLRWKNYLWPQENFSDKNLIGEWEIWGGILGFTSRWNACSYQKTPRTCYQEFVDEVLVNNRERS
ncbi:hypothetical protein JHK86_006331 [Glycine max]|nr:hypothetical protein JHK86_006331 [Glycine max]